MKEVPSGEKNRNKERQEVEEEKEEQESTMGGKERRKTRIADQHLSSSSTHDTYERWVYTYGTYTPYTHMHDLDE